jgi:hypothetical protein
MNTKQLELEQSKVADAIVNQYGIDRERIYFLNQRKPLEPWIPPDQLIICARQEGGFREIEDQFDQFVDTLKQVIHRGRVVDAQGRVFTCIGVATLGEQPIKGVIFDEHQLAGGRAVSAALTAGGFNPFKVGSNQSFKPVATLDDEAREDRVQSPAVRRNNDIARIHILAEQAGLIHPHAHGHAHGVDSTKYRAWLRENFGVGSSTEASQEDRARIINALENWLIEAN